MRKANNLCITVASFLHGAAHEVNRLRPHIPIYLAERQHPFAIIKKVKALGAAGTDLHVWLLNPITYFMAKRGHVIIMVYTVNSSLLGHLVGFLYPGVELCTNHPARFLPHEAAHHVLRAKRWQQLRKLFADSPRTT